MERPFSVANLNII